MTVVSSVAAERASPFYTPTTLPVILDPGSPNRMDAASVGLCPRWWKPLPQAGTAVTDLPHTTPGPERPMAA